MRCFDDGDAFDSGLSMVKVNEISPAVQEQVDMEIKRLLQVNLVEGQGYCFVSDHSSLSAL